MVKKLTQEEFLKKAKKVHKDKYNYDNFIYKGMGIKGKIYCNNCNKYFEQIPHSHLRGHGCPYCAIKNNANNLRKSLKTFIKECKKIHGNKDNYDYVVYTNDKTNIKLFCNSCKKYYETSPHNYLKGHRCPYCKNKKTVERITLSWKKVLKRFKEIHGNKYIYLSKYEKLDKEMLIKCKKCKLEFKQSPKKHINGYGCPICGKTKILSKGEEIIKNYLENNKIKFISQFRFKDCKYKIPLPFDFYLPDYNMCIEFQGAQHYDISFFFSRIKSKEKSIELFNKLKIRDKVKKDYCKLHNIILLEIKYNEDIKNVLNNNLLKNNFIIY